MYTVYAYTSTHTPGFAYIWYSTAFLSHSSCQRSMAIETTFASPLDTYSSKTIPSIWDGTIDLEGLYVIVHVSGVKYARIPALSHFWDGRDLFSWVFQKKRDIWDCPCNCHLKVACAAHQVWRASVPHVITTHLGRITTSKRNVRVLAKMAISFREGTEFKAILSKWSSPWNTVKAVSLGQSYKLISKYKQQLGHEIR